MIDWAPGCLCLIGVMNWCYCVIGHFSGSGGSAGVCETESPAAADSQGWRATGRGPVWPVGGAACSTGRTPYTPHSDPENTTWWPGLPSWVSASAGTLWRGCNLEGKPLSSPELRILEAHALPHACQKEAAEWTSAAVIMESQVLRPDLGSNVNETNPNSYL